LLEIIPDEDWHSGHQRLLHPLHKRRPRIGLLLNLYINQRILLSLQIFQEKERGWVDRASKKGYRLYIEKNSLIGEKKFLFIEDSRLFIEDNRLYIEENSLFFIVFRKLSLYGGKSSV
jgi:hypothetical protein